MNVTRKKFLFTVVAGVAGAAMHPLSAANSAGGRDGTEPLSPATSEDSSERRFTSRRPTEEGSIDVVLEAIDERPPSNGTHQFSLTFVAPGGERLAEGTYTVEQERMGRFPLFVTPTRRDGQGRTFFRADFNLLLQKSIRRA